MKFLRTQALAFRRMVRQQLVKLAESYLKSTYVYQCRRCREPTPSLHLGKFCSKCLIAACQRQLNPNDVYYS